MVPNGGPFVVSSLSQISIQSCCVVVALGETLGSDLRRPLLAASKQLYTHVNRKPLGVLLAFLRSYSLLQFVPDHGP